MSPNSKRSSIKLLAWALVFHTGALCAQPAEPGDAANPATTADTAPVAVAEPANAATTPQPEESPAAGASAASQPAATPVESTAEPTAAEPATEPAAEPAAESPSYSAEGADSCLKCHDEDAAVPVLDIFKTKHAVRADERTPFAQLQCESCHGPGGEHAKRIRRGETRPPIRNFGRHANAPAAEQNGVCLDCHEKHDRADWRGSPHEREDVPCAACHRVHATRDPVLTADTQTEVCVECHKRQRTEIHKASTHPLRYGEMACTDCHSPHGSTADALLKRATLNQTCFECHAEKRGPFLWEHAPAAEDCSLCHRPHGSNHPDLLTRRPPLLCQQCHSPLGHPSVQYTGRGLAGEQPSPRVLAGSCTNCHSQVHGSNHPSGADLSR